MLKFCYKSKFFVVALQLSPPACLLQQHFTINQTQLFLLPQAGYFCTDE
jgi:hypothetical protein